VTGRGLHHEVRIGQLAGGLTAWRPGDGGLGRYPPAQFERNREG
jgi:hypothetical protein